MINEIQKISKIAVFKGKQIRKTIHNDEWFFSIIDIYLISIIIDNGIF